MSRHFFTPALPSKVVLAITDAKTVWMPVWLELKWTRALLQRHHSQTVVLIVYLCPIYQLIPVCNMSFWRTLKDRQPSEMWNLSWSRRNNSEQLLRVAAQRRWQMSQVGSDPHWHGVCLKLDQRSSMICFQLVRHSEHFHQWRGWKISFPGCLVYCRSKSSEHQLSVTQDLKSIWFGRTDSPVPFRYILYRLRRLSSLEQDPKGAILSWINSGARNVFDRWNFAVKFWYLFFEHILIVFKLWVSFLVAYHFCIMLTCCDEASQTGTNPGGVSTETAALIADCKFLITIYHNISQVFTQWNSMKSIVFEHNGVQLSYQICSSSWSAFKEDRFH